MNTLGVIKVLLVSLAFEHRVSTIFFGLIPQFDKIKNEARTKQIIVIFFFFLIDLFVCLSVGSLRLETIEKEEERLKKSKQSQKKSLLVKKKRKNTKFDVFFPNEPDPSN